MAMGYLSSEIVQLGPDCTSIFGSFEATQNWIACWRSHYQNSADLEKLRIIDEGYWPKLMNYELEDIKRIREIRNPNIVAYRSAESGKPVAAAFDPQPFAPDHRRMWEGVDKVDCGLSPEQRVFLGTNYQIGIVPPTARVGDIIVRFWNCDAAVVMRPTRLRTAPNASPSQSFLLVGRADVAEVVDRRATPGRDIHAEEALFSAFGPDNGQAGRVWIHLDLATLQAISASIIT